MSKKIIDRIGKIRFKFLVRHPFLGDLALRLVVKESPSIAIENEEGEKGKHFQVPTMGTDSKYLYYNEEYVNSLSEEFLEGVIAHEVGHCLFRHCGKEGLKRQKKHNQEVWTLACEYSVNYFTVDLCNLTLKGNPFDIKVDTPPAEGTEEDNPIYYYDSKYSDGEWTTESIYHDLMKNDKVQQYAKDAEAFKKMVEGMMGDDHSQWGKDGGGKITGDMDKDWKIWAAQAAQNAKKQGKLPAGMERLVDGMLDPKIPWRSHLAEFLTHKSKDDYTWKRANRRQLHRKIIAPSLYSEAMNIAYVMDTSGSMGEKELAEGLAEVKEICASLPSFNLYIMGCDADVHYYEHVTDWIDIDIKGLCRGGGGTSFRPPFDKIAEEDVELDALVYFTDAYGDFPEQPDYPVLWVVMEGYSGEIPFGKVIDYN